MATSNAGGASSSSAEELISAAATSAAMIEKKMITLTISAAATSAATTEKKMITLRSNDNESFEVDENIATELGILKNAGGAEDHIYPVLNMSGAVLRKVIDYCKRHGEAMEKKEKAATAEEKRSIDGDLKKFDQEFVKLDEHVLFELMLAANHLLHDGLLDLTCQAVANVLESKSIEEVREIFSIENDFTPEEEEAVRNENKWAFE